jgi:subtilisin family serine protease
MRIPKATRAKRPFALAGAVALLIVPVAAASTVTAPGRSITSTWPGGRYVTISGTSMATPHVAGVLALLKSTHPDTSPAQLISMLKAQADDLACPEGDARCEGPATDNGFYGDGLVDALDAVSRGQGAHPRGKNEPPARDGRGGSALSSAFRPHTREPRNNPRCHVAA